MIVYIAKQYKKKLSCGNNVYAILLYLTTKNQKYMVCNALSNTMSKEKGMEVIKGYHFTMLALLIKVQVSICSFCG